MKKPEASDALTLPRLEDVDPEYAALATRAAELEARERGLKVRQAELLASVMASNGGDGAKVHSERVAALVDGVTLPQRTPEREELGKLTTELRDLADARHELGTRLKAQHRRASAKACEVLRDRHTATVARAFIALADVASIRCEISEMRRAAERAGIEPIGLHDALEGIFDEPMIWTSDLAMDLRKAAKDGLLDQAKIPAALRVKK